MPRRNGFGLLTVARIRSRFQEDTSHETQLRDKFVADMNRAVKFYRDVLGLPPEVRVPRLERIYHRRNHAGVTSSLSEESGGRCRVGLHGSRHSKLPSGDESERRSVQYATNETRLRRLTSAVRGLRGRTL